MIKSRLRMRRVTKTLTVKNKTLASNQHSESNLLTGQVATHEPTGGEELLSEAGQVVVATDVFWFEAAAGASLPAITEEHVLVDESDSTRYEVVARPLDQAGAGDRLKVETQRIKTS